MQQLNRLFIKSKIQFFESKSQRSGVGQRIVSGCLSSQRYNFLKANHNFINGIFISTIVVYQVKDTIFWKQITTPLLCILNTGMLFIKSKIQFFESKSQRSFTDFSIQIVVYQVKDTIFWKQITTNDRRNRNWLWLFIKSKIQFFESKSQLTLGASTTKIGCLSSQRYNFLKANHNVVSGTPTINIVVYQVKDTIFWKQITTNAANNVLSESLFIKSKIQFFESKSQPTSCLTANAFSCLSSQRYNFLKANHNKSKQLIIYIFVVYQVKDTIFWKQITTTSITRNKISLLFIKSKIQFFESKSQPT